MTGSCCTSQIGLELGAVLLSPPPECRSHRFEPSNSGFILLSRVSCPLLGCVYPLPGMTAKAGLFTQGLSLTLSALFISLPWLSGQQRSRVCLFLTPSASHGFACLSSFHSSPFLSPQLQPQPPLPTPSLHSPSLHFPVSTPQPPL